MPPTTSAVAAGTNAINATTRGCRREGMVSGCVTGRVLSLEAMDLAALSSLRDYFPQTISASVHV